MKQFLTFALGITAAYHFVVAAIVSPPAQPTTSAAGNSFNPIFSGDGQHLVFVSHANNLVTNDDLGLWLDVFVRDLVNSNTVLVSVSTNGAGGANADANYPSVSENGQFIAFASQASNLVPGDTNGTSDIFVRDLNAGVTRLVNRDLNGAIPAPSDSGHPIITAEGRWVFFESTTLNLTTNQVVAGNRNIYRRDVWSNTTALASLNVSGGFGGLPLRCELSSATPDGSFAVYVIVTNLNGAADAFVHDMNSGTSHIVSTNVRNFLPAGDYRCSSPVLSDDGRYVAFFASSASTNAHVFRHDLQTGNTVLIVPSATNISHGLQISSTGHRVLFEYSEGIYARTAFWDEQFGFAPIVCGDELRGNATMTPGATAVAYIGCSNVYVVGPSNALVSVNTNGVPSSGDYYFVTPAVSPDGGRVAFAVTASDLAAGDLNGMSDIFLRDVNAGVTELVTKALPATPATVAFTHSFLGPRSVSADGRFVVSTRYDDPSAHRDTNGLIDVFVSDVVNGTSLAVSINTNLYYPATDGEAGASAGMFIDNTNVFRNPIISADGSTVVAVWYSGGYFSKIFGTTLTNGLLGSKNMSLLTRSTSGFGIPGNVDSPSLSADGRLLAFRSDDTQNGFDFIPDSNGYSDVWLRYPRIREWGPPVPMTNYILLSGYGNANGPSFAPLISADGGRVLFATRAGNLLRTTAGGVSGQYANYQIMAALVGTNNNPTNILYNLPLRLCSYTISFQPYEWIDAYDTNVHHTNLNAILTPIPADISNAVFSADNRFVVYAHADGSAIWRHDLSKTQTNYTFVSQAPHPNESGSVVATNLVPAEANTLVCSNCRNPSVSADGSVVTYERTRLTSSIVDLFAKDLSTGEETLVSANVAGTVANASSVTPLVSGHGRYIVFQSRASDLSANDTNGASDIFVRDRLLGVAMLVSANSQGRSGNGPSTRPVLAANGRTIVFQSLASDLVAGDYNDKRDLFALELGGVDSEPDGMDDDWEMAYFLTLSRNGSDDYDNDGASDLAEFRAGTDPTNAGSVFRVLTVTPAGGGTRLLFWTGNPARTYRAEYKDDLSTSGWASLTGTISWNGSTASIPDPTAGDATNRYYRVVRLP